MLLTVLRRLAGNRWKALSMLAGLTLALAMAFSVPVYSDAILQRLLNKTFEDRLLETERYPAYLSLKYEMAAVEKDAVGTMKTLENTYSGIAEKIGLPSVVSGKYIRYSMLFRDADTLSGRENLVMFYVQDLEDHINITTGRMYDPTRNDGVVEAVVRRTFLVNSDMTLGEVYEVKSSANSSTVFKIEIVGIFEASDNSEYFWFTKSDRFGGNVFVDCSYINSIMETNPSATRHMTQLVWYSALDYTSIDIDDVSELIAAYEAGKEEVINVSGKDALTFSANQTLGTLEELSSKLYVTLYSLLVPLLVVISFYVVMIARLKLKSEQNEISVMQSRGAGRGHILRLYLIESVLLVGAAAVLGPILGLLMCRMIGASNGFLSFVNRSALPLKLEPEAFLSLFIAALLFIVITMIPAVLSAGVNIVESKRLKNISKTPFYHKYFLDVLLLAAGIYGWYSMQVRMLLLDSSGVLTIENTDIMMYVSGTLFALGAGMLFLRIYPYILRFIFRIGKRAWPAWSYFTLNRVSRNRECAGIMLFMILTISIGVTSADTARSINRYIEKNIEVQVGADAVYTPVWRKYDENGNYVSGAVRNGNKIEIYDDGVLVQSITVKYLELLTDSFKEFGEIESIARVYREEDVTVKRDGSQTQNVDVMLTDPYEFALTANWPSDLGSYHINDYANALNRFENSCVVSVELMETLKLELGDRINILVGSGYIECTVVAAVESWPGLEKYTRYGNTDEIVRNKFVIARLSDYMEENEVRPYDFFIKKADGVSDMELYNALYDSEFGMINLESSGERLTDEKNSPVLQGTNGMLTVSFMAAVALCAAGFMVYWVISIKERTLQFGISRALGVTRAGVMKMLALEQLLVSGAAVAAGIFIGRVQSIMFVPFLSMNYTSEYESIAFRVLTSSSDLLRILGVLGAVLAVCLAVLFTIVVRQKVDRALKLGED